MKAKIVSIHNHGDFDKEYVLIEVLKDCDIGKFILADSTYTAAKTISNKLRHVLWFPDENVAPHDYVVVYTKAGKNESVKNNSGKTIHSFYWGLQTPVWNDAGDCAVLIEALEWQFFRAKD